MAEWDVNDLEYWDEKIREKVEEFGLSCYPQEFEICDHFQMLGYMAYSGMTIPPPRSLPGLAGSRKLASVQFSPPARSIVTSPFSVAFLPRR